MRANILIVAISGAFALGTAYAQITKDEFKSRQDVIEANYKASKERCNPLAGNAKDICQAQVKGEYDVARKELEAAYKPSDKNRYDVRVAKAEAAYKVAKEKCDDQAGNAKDVCVKEAKAAEARAKADEKIADARMDAAETKRDADYKVAKEKCDALAGQAKDNCVAAAKLKFGKS